MVAKDGALCGTSPAWCLPFYNLWLLYARTGDRAWLTDLVPRLEAYLDFWLQERTDEEGWIVYKCTWEAGEDCTPRLDPAEEGDEVISRYVRPVELQATFSQSARILARFAREIGDAERERRWDSVASEYARRTQTLWDDVEGRYRDWDKRSGTFLESRKEAAGANLDGPPRLYWQTDPVRYSALSLTPLVAGIAGEDQTERLREEIEAYDVAPWCLWPSWSFVVAEAASTAGWHDFAGRYANRVVDRVYRGNDRRTLADAPRPTPGTSPEFWPLDLADFNGSDGYGWGATTTSLWVRQIFGFLEGDNLAEYSFALAPSLPPDFLRPGRRYGFRGLPYRGSRLDLTYEVDESGLEAVVRVSPPRPLRVVGPTGEMPARYDAETGETRFRVGNGLRTSVEELT